MVTIINNNDFTFNGVKPGSTITIEDQYLEIYRENGFDIASEDPNGGKKTTIKNVAPKDPEDPETPKDPEDPKGGKK